MLRAVRSLLSDTGFLAALVIAAFGALAVVAVARWSSWRVGFGGVTLVAALVAIRVDGLELEWQLVVGLALLALAASRGAASLGVVARVVALVTGAVFLVVSMSHVAGWMRVLGFLAVMGAVPSAGVVDRRVARIVPALMLLAAAGVYVCAPDTEYSKVLLGALVPVALLVFDPVLPASATTGAVSALVVWTAVVEGRGRAGAVVGTLACVAVVLGVAATRWRWRRARDAVTLLAVDAVSVFYMARVAGLQSSAWSATILAAPMLVLTWVVVMRVSRRH
jgi:hypothetical protein